MKLRVLRRYPNRRLYDAETRGYVALEAVAKWLEQGEAIKIVEQRTDRDITAETLAPVIASTVLNALRSYSPYEIAAFLQTIRDGALSTLLTRGADPRAVPVSVLAEPALDARVKALEHAVSQLLNRPTHRPREPNER